MDAADFGRGILDDVLLLLLLLLLVPTGTVAPDQTPPLVATDAADACDEFFNAENETKGTTGEIRGCRRCCCCCCCVFAGYILLSLLPTPLLRRLRNGFLCKPASSVSPLPPPAAAAAAAAAADDDDDNDDTSSLSTNGSITCGPALACKPAPEAAVACAGSFTAMRPWPGGGGDGKERGDEVVMQADMQNAIRHTSHITRHTSHITRPRHTSHVTRHASHNKSPFCSHLPETLDLILSSPPPRSNWLGRLTGSLRH